MFIRETKSLYLLLVIMGAFLIVMQLSSCKKYLEEKSNKSLVVPKNLEDMQAMLDNTYAIIAAEPCIPEVAADNYYLKASDLTSLNVDIRNNYTWDANAQYSGDWYQPYQVVLYANIILENITKVDITAANSDQWKRIKGGALFFRSHSFFNVAQEFCKVYNSSTAIIDPGIVLRLSPDINEISARATMEDTYQRIVSDLKESVRLLPVATTYPTRPNRAAAYGELARVYLMMSDYKNAEIYSDSCLAIHSDLIDYNDLDGSLTSPIPSLNAEIIFQCVSSSATSLTQSRAKVDSFLYQSYDSNDLRKAIFFKNNGNGTYAFKGTYDGTFTGGLSVCFTGIAADEISLIKAECIARLGRPDDAMDELNRLLEKRWKSGTFLKQTASTSEEALGKVLRERRKELLFRCRRWFDLKRLNKESKFAETITRVIDGQVYTLKPDDPKYVLLIPALVTKFSNLEQNPR